MWIKMMSFKAMAVFGTLADEDIHTHVDKMTTFSLSRPLVISGESDVVVCCVSFTSAVAPFLDSYMILSTYLYISPFIYIFIQFMNLIPSHHDCCF